MYLSLQVYEYDIIGIKNTINRSVDMYMSLRVCEHEVVRIKSTILYEVANEAHENQ